MDTPRIPTPDRLAEIRAGIVAPNPVERRYLAGLDAGMSAGQAWEAAQSAPPQASRAPNPASRVDMMPKPVQPTPAAPEPEAPAPPDLAELVPSLDRTTRWYQPDPRHISSVRRAVWPAIIATSLVLTVQLGLLFTDLLVPEAGAVVQVIILVIAAITGGLMLASYNGHRHAAFILLVLHVGPIGRSALSLRDGFDPAILVGIGLGLALAGLWATAWTTLRRYHDFLKGLPSTRAAAFGK